MSTLPSISTVSHRGRRGSDVSAAVAAPAAMSAGARSAFQIKDHLLGGESASRLMMRRLPMEGKDRRQGGQRRRPGRRNLPVTSSTIGTAMSFHREAVNV